MTSLLADEVVPESNWQRIRAKRRIKFAVIESTILSLVIGLVLLFFASQFLMSRVLPEIIRNAGLVLLGALGIWHLVTIGTGSLSFQRAFSNLGRGLFSFVFGFFFKIVLALIFPVLFQSVRRRLSLESYEHASLRNWARGTAEVEKGCSTWVEWQVSTERESLSLLPRVVSVFVRLRKSVGLVAALLLVMAVLLGAILVFVQTSAVAPFIYTLF